MRRADSVESIGKIAVVGMTCRLPGARNPGEFWENLAQGKETISFFSEQDLLDRGVKPAEFSHPNYVKARGVYEGTFLFDAPLFGYTPREGELLDPQHRVFLECVWEALENAGYSPSTYSGRIGLFAGAGASSHLMMLINEPSVVNSVGMLSLLSSNEKDFLATRVGYKLNLKGPCVTVQTACSTSLVAIVLACQSLLTYQSDLAMAGGVTLDPDEGTGYYYDEGGISSPDGHCRTFDSAAKGTVFSSGAGVVVLKRLKDALADRDTIHAVIIGTGLNNDGSAKIGYTAPSVDGQVAVSSQALAAAGINPETISYVECHGTATPIGDPIEIKALSRTFRAYTQKKNFCAVGSVKSNLGHTDAAAGVAGFIKTVLALEHKQIPASLHFVKPNPEIDFVNSPFYVNTVLSEWKRGETPRRAGLNSFGIGGTNAHVILEEAPKAAQAKSARPWELLLWSAKNAETLDLVTANFGEYLKQHPETSLADAAYTLQVGRTHLPYRRMLVCRDIQDAIRILDGEDPTRLLTRAREKRAASLAFMFPGQGAQYINMAKDLYQTERIFREQISECAELARHHLGYDLRDLIYPPEDQTAKATELLAQTANTQPVLFVIEYALARLWMKWGLQPDAMIGHSIGEYVAACLAGVFSLQDVIRVVVARGRLMQELPHGAMLSVLLAEREMAPWLRGMPSLSIAAVNAPNSCVVSGPIADIDQLQRELAAKDVPCSRLHTSHAFHSAMMDPILEKFRKLVKDVKLNAPGLPFVSNLTGNWITPAEATDPEYWVKHLRHTVRFSAGCQTLLKDPDRILLEVGPGRTLSTLVSRHPEKNADQQAFSSLPGPQEAQPDDFPWILSTVGRLWLEGIALNWTEFYAGESRGRIPLPTYPFERRVYRLRISGAETPSASAIQPSNKKKADVADWFYYPSWKQTAPLPAAPLSPENGSCLVFRDDCGLGLQVEEKLRQQGLDVISVTAGTKFEQTAESSFSIDPGNRDHCVALVAELRRAGKALGMVIHLWGVTPDEHPREEIDCLEGTMQKGFFSLLRLAQAIGTQYSNAAIWLHVVASNAHDISGGAVRCPSKALMLGPCKAIPREYPNIQSRYIDINLNDPHVSRERMLASLLAELGAIHHDEVVAYRGGHRWIQAFEPFRCEAPTESHSRLREKGVYLITGGLGGIGLVLAGYLAEAVQAKLVLLGRSSFPEKSLWDGWLQAHPEGDRISGKIRQLRRMEEMGAEVMVCSADVANREQMREVMQRVKQRFGEIHGVVHSAGVPGDGIIELKTNDVAEAVLAPKVRGTLVLEQLLQKEPLDFFFLCSSLTAFFGAAGQVDYTAANAFLDAFAHARKDRKIAPISINWDRWNEVGMAVDAELTQKSGNTTEDESAAEVRGNSQEFRHPIFTGRSKDGDVETFFGYLAPAEHWVVGDHKIMGIPTLVGTAYLELARAAFAEQRGDGPLELRDVVFLSPLMVQEGEKVEVGLILKPAGEQWEFKIRSRSGKSGWQEHASGKIGYAASPAAAETCDIPALLANFNSNGQKAQGEETLALGSSVVQAGRRWQTLVSLAQKSNEGLAVLALDDEFVSDLDDFVVHPALLDCATAFSIAWAAKGGVYLPYSYESIQIRKPTGRKLYCHARFTPAAAPDDELLTIDVDIFDEQGELLVRVRGYSLKQVSGALLKKWDQTTSGETPVAKASDGQQNPFKDAEWGILSKEGVEVFRRVLALDGISQIAVASVDLNWLSSQAKSVADEGYLETKSASTMTLAHPRPNLATAYVAPRSDLEQSIADLWQSVLGISKIGIYDNFVELGGHSLMAVHLASRVRDMFEIDLPVAKFYGNPTIAGLAEAIVKILAAQVDSEMIAQALEAVQTAPQEEQTKEVGVV